MQVAQRVEKKRRIRRPRQKPRLVVVHGGKELATEEGNALLADLGRRMSERSQSRISARIARLPSAPERQSIRYAMLMIELRLVKAFWTIARQPLGMVQLRATSNGLSYVHDREDTHARYADAPGGKWETVAPRPSLPSSKDIDAANEALDWLLLIDDERLRKLLVAGATSKRGDAGRRINWTRLRSGFPEYAAMTVRTMQRHYESALRMIVTEMTLASANKSLLR